MAATGPTTGGLHKEYEGASVGHHDHAEDYSHHHNGLRRSSTAGDPDTQAYGGNLQAGMFRQNRKFANPAPLGLSAFALTTFVLSLINLNTRGVSVPAVVLALAFGYGGLVQLLAGMWEMAVGNTFGATALASYGGFWISYAIIETPGGFGIVNQYGTNIKELQYALGFYLIGWWIFTTLLLCVTLRSTVAFFSLFFTLDLAFLMLAISRFQLTAANEPNPGLQKAGGVFGLLAAFLAWYNAYAGLADESNSFFRVKAVHFPWSDTGKARREQRRKASVV